jgi:hypothetical protein
MPGFASKFTWKLPAGPGGGEALELTGPRAQGNRVLVGTRKQTAGAPGRLLCLRGTAGPREGLVLGQIELKADPATDSPDGAESVLWLHPELALVAHGGGGLALISVQSSGALSVLDELPRALQEGSVRDMATSPNDGAWVAAGGYSRKLALICLEQPDQTQLLPTGGTIGSVRWSADNQGVCPSATLDSGELLIYDVRTRPTAVLTYEIDVRKDDLFAHERLSDHHVLLGFNHGKIMSIDLRKTSGPLASVQDPFVKAIGNLEYDAQRQHLIVSGVPDLTVYGYDPGTGRMDLRAHYYPGYSFPSLGCEDELSGTMMAGDPVVACTAGGYFSLINLDMPEAKAGGERKEAPSLLLGPPESSDSASSSSSTAVTGQ